MAQSQLNRVLLQANLTRDPELRSTSGGTPVCSARVANTRRMKVAEEWVDKPNYFDVTVWGSRGEAFSRLFSRGDTVLVDGHMEWREWTDKDGNKRQSVEIVADDWFFPGGGRREAPVEGDIPMAIEEPVGFGGGATTAAEDDSIPF